MKRYIVLLRAVNVGSTKVPMSEFREMLGSIGCQNVSTYVQSGNAIIDSDVSAQSISESIHSSMEEKYGYDIKVFIYEPKDFDRIIAENPFIGRGGVDPTKLHATFLAEIPDTELVSSLDPHLGGDDEWELKGKTLYLYCPHGYGKSKLTNALFERKFKVDATTRNWKTVVTLADLSA